MMIYSEERLYGLSRTRNANNGMVEDWEKKATPTILRVTRNVKESCFAPIKQNQNLFKFTMLSLPPSPVITKEPHKSSNLVVWPQIDLCTCQGDEKARPTCIITNRVTGLSLVHKGRERERGGGESWEESRPADTTRKYEKVKR